MQHSLDYARLSSDRSFTYQDDFGVGSQSFITATEKDMLGEIASARASYSLVAGLKQPGGRQGFFTAEQDRCSADGSAVIATTLFREDDSQRVSVMAGGQTFESWQYDVFNNNGAPSSTFVFDPGYGRDVVNLFRAGGADHDTVSLKGSDFGNSIAAVLQNTHRLPGGGSLIVDPTSGDAVRLTGITKAQLVHNQSDIAFHA